MTPTVDVIIPCFNYGRMLTACVQSVLSQEAVQVRVLVMDDASTDETEGIGRQLAAGDGRVEYRRHPVNRGHIATYNEALALVTGQYCVILSADDLLTPGSLARAMRVMEEHPDIGLIYGRDIPFKDRPPLDAPRASARWRRRHYDEFLESACRLGHTGIQSPTALVRTTLHHRIGGYLPALPHSGDTEIWLRMAAAADVAELDADQAFRRLHHSNMSLTFSPVGRIEEQQKAFDTHFAERHRAEPRMRALQALAHRTMAESAFWVAAHAFDDGDEAACRSALAFAARVSPGIEQWGPWRRLRWKRRIGATAWRLMQPLALRLQRAWSRDPVIGAGLRRTGQV